MDDAELMGRAAAVVRANVLGDLTDIVLVMAAGRRSVGVVGPGAGALLRLCADAARVVRHVSDRDGTPRPCSVLEVTPWFATFVAGAGGKVDRLGERHVWACEPPTDDVLRDSPVARRATLDFIVRQQALVVAAERSRLARHAVEAARDPATRELAAPGGDGPGGAPALGPPGR